MARVIIKSLPKKQSGGTTGKTGDQQASYGLNTGNTINYNTDVKDGSKEDVRSMYPKVDREDANVEIEKGEYVVSPDLGSIYQAGGKKHYAGGTPIKAKEGSYIVSDFIKTNEPIMAALGFEYDPKNDKKQTWAQLLKSKIDPKEYNSFASLLKDKEQGKVVDPYEYNTAKNKLPDYQTTVSKVALGNELTKAIMGKPYNIPEVAQSAMQSLQQPQQNSKDGDPLFKAKVGGLYKAPDGTEYPIQNNNVAPGTGVLQNVAPYHQSYGNLDGIMQGVDLATKYPWYKPFTSSHTQQGQITPTKDNSLYTGDVSSQYQNIPYWEKINGKPFNNMQDFQGFMFNKLKEQDPSTINTINNVWGNTAAGKLDDGYGGARTAFAASQRLPSSYNVTIPNTPAPIIPPTVVPPVIPPVVPPVKKPAIDFNNNKNPQKLGFDVNNIVGLLNANRTDPTRYPWEAKSDVNLVDPSFDSTNYYPIQSAQRSRMDSMNQISSPSMARSVGSYQPDQINGILQETQRVHGNNLGIANAAQTQNAQIMNQYNANEAQRQTGLYNNTVKTLDNRDTTNRLQRNDVATNLGKSWSDYAEMNKQLQMHPQFGLLDANNYSKGFGFDGNGKSIYDKATNEVTPMDNFKSIQDQYQNYSPEQHMALYHTLYNGKDDYVKSVKKAGQQGSTTTTMNRS